MAAVNVHNERQAGFSRYTNAKNKVKSGAPSAAFASASVNGSVG